MFKRKITVSKELYAKLKLAAEVAGCSSTDELARAILERETDRLVDRAGKGQPSKEEVDAIAQKLKGLGYLD